MNNGPGQQDDGCGVDVESSRLLVDDLVRYLLRLAALEKDARTGNRELSASLHELATLLKPYSNSPLADLADKVAKVRTSGTRNRKTRRTELPADLNSLSANSVERILASPRYTKLQVIEVGSQRFGISRSRLMRLGREQVIEAVRAALEHEQSIQVISEEARRQGEKRFS